MLGFVEFILSLIIFSVIYVLPAIGLIFTDTNQKRWLGHWMVTVFAFNILIPILNMIFPKWSVQLIVIFLGVYRLLRFRN